MFARCVLQSRVCALGTNLISAIATEVNFISDVPMFIQSRRVSQKNRFMRTAYLSRNSGFPRIPDTIDYHRRAFRRTCAGRCRAAKRKRVHRQRARAREAGSRATVNRFSMPLKNAPPSAVIILIDTQARPRRPAVPLAYNALTLARAFARCRRYAPDRAPLDEAHVSGPGERKTRAPTTFGDRRRRIPRRARACTTAGDTRNFRGIPSRERQAAM